jgi:hypothetical protein
MRAIAGAILLIASGWSAVAAERGPAQELARIEAQLARHPILRAAFEQERTMRVLKRPLLSRGHVTAVAGRGVLWQVREPHQATVLMTGEEMVEWGEDGTPRRMGLGANPGLRTLAGALLGVLIGDTGELAELFELTSLPAERGWRLLLAPKDPDLAAMVTEVEIAGGQFVEEILIREAGGDRTAIAFEEFRTEPDVLEASEEAYFAR